VVKSQAKHEVIVSVKMPNINPRQPLSTLINQKKIDTKYLKYYFCRGKEFRSAAEI
jgi:hypothetical protein